MKLQFLLVFLSISSLAFCQDEDERPLRIYEPISGPAAIERRERLRQDPALLELAARTNERILIEIDGPDFVAIVEENVNVNMDCLPWLMLFPGGDIKWFVRARDINGNPGIIIQ